MHLVIGANSEIGAATARRLGAGGEKVLTTTRRPADVSETCILLDFDRPVDGFTPPAGVRSACIFVAVARLAGCEADPVSSARINCERTIALVERLSENGVYTLFLSTNQVFDGLTPHVKADAPTSPVSEYGRQKAFTEARLGQMMSAGAPIGILRLAKVVSPRMALLEDWSRKLLAGEPVRAFHDMTMAPTPTDLVARMIGNMMEDRIAAVAQLTGPRDISYLHVARFLAQRLGADDRFIEPVSALAQGMPRGATPRNTTLDSSFASERYAISVPDGFDVIDSLGVSRNN